MRHFWQAFPLVFEVQLCSPPPIILFPVNRRVKLSFPLQSLKKKIEREGRDVRSFIATSNRFLVAYTSILSIPACLRPSHHDLSTGRTPTNHKNFPNTLKNTHTSDDVIWVSEPMYFKVSSLPALILFPNPKWHLKGCKATTISFREEKLDSWVVFKPFASSISAIHILSGRKVLWARKRHVAMFPSLKKCKSEQIEVRVTWGQFPNSR